MVDTVVETTVTVTADTIACAVDEVLAEEVTLPASQLSLHRYCLLEKDVPKVREDLSAELLAERELDDDGLGLPVDDAETAAILTELLASPPTADSPVTAMFEAML